MYPASLTAYHKVHSRKTNFCNPPPFLLGEISGRKQFYCFCSSSNTSLLSLNYYQAYRNNFYISILLFYTQPTAHPVKRGLTELSN